MAYTSTAYDAGFYADQQDRSASSADVIVPIVLSLFPVTSVVDVGCGVGTWLQAFVKHGVSDFVGLDGSYVPLDMLKIPRTHFREMDLAEPTSIGRRFDLACSLEVAEHLPMQCAAQFVALLTDAAPVVVFSAAVPHQGGTSHINEQWQSYWIELFAGRGYRAFDCVRPVVHGNYSVEWWYRQNTIIFCDDAHRPNGRVPIECPFEANRVDPGMVNALVEQFVPDDSIRRSLDFIKRDVASLWRGVLRRLTR